MLVYSTTLWFRCSFEELVNIIAEQLSYRVKTHVSKLNLDKDDGHFSKESDKIHSVRWLDDGLKLQSITYTYPDEMVKGRQWKTEVGLRQRGIDADVECSIVLSTSEISTRVNQPIRVTRPRLVRTLLERCSPSSKTPGNSLIHLNEDNAADLLNLIESRERQSTIVIVSPTMKGTYPIEPYKILWQVGGIAEVVQIAVGANTFRIQEILGDRYAAWRGAINLIFPAIGSRAERIIPTYRLRLEQLEMMLGDAPLTPQIENIPICEILSLITHQVNLSNSWRHVSPEYIREQRRQYELSTRRGVSVGVEELEAYISLLEEDNQEYIRDKDELKSELDDLREQVSLQDTRIDELKSEAYRLNMMLEARQTALHYGSSRIRSSSGSLNNEIRDAFINVVNEQATLEEMLRLFEVLFEDRLTILENAYESARQSWEFQHRRRAFELLLKLVTKYYDCLMEGKGDYEARNIFGEAFAGKESETVENNRRARLLRTFTYKGEDVLMFKHLRIGVKDSVRDTLRVHFYWDADGARMVIGHCGAHLDHG